MVSGRAVEILTMLTPRVFLEMFKMGFLHPADIPVGFNGTLADWTAHSLQLRPKSSLSLDSVIDRNRTPVTALVNLAF